MNHFKEINDTLGHDTGDRALRELAGILEGSIRKNDRAHRFGGDEFILLIDTHDARVLESTSATIREKIKGNAFFQSLNTEIGKTIEAAMGLSVFQKGVSLEEQLKIADIAMYANKANLKGRK